MDNEFQTSDTRSVLDNSSHFLCIVPIPLEIIVYVKFSQTVTTCSGQGVYEAG